MQKETASPIAPIGLSRKEPIKKFSPPWFTGMHRNVYKQVTDWSAFQLPTLDLKQLNSSLFLNSSPFFITQLNCGVFQRIFWENPFWSFFPILNMSFLLRESQNLLPHLCSTLRILLVLSTSTKFFNYLL